MDEESIVARVAQKRSRRRRSARLRRIAIASLAFLMAGTGVVLAAQALRTHRSTASHLSRPRPARNGSIAIVLDTVGKERDVLSLFTVEPDGSGLKLLLRDRPDRAMYHLAWAPDGRRLALTTLDETTGIQGIDILDAQGGARQPLVRLPLHQAPSSPRWTLDGTRLAFVLTDYHPQPERGGRLSEADDSMTIVIVDLATRQRQTIRRDGQITSFSWAPDGRRLVYALQTLLPGSTRFSSDLYIASLDGSADRRLTTDGTSAGPAWSPDGHSIAFTQRTAPDSSPIGFVMVSDGSAVHQVTTEPGGTPLLTPGRRMGGCSSTYSPAARNVAASASRRWREGSLVYC